MTSPLFSIASADSDTDKDARGENARWERVRGRGGAGSERQRGERRTRRTRRMRNKTRWKISPAGSGSFLQIVLILKSQNQKAMWNVTVGGAEMLFDFLFRSFIGISSPNMTSKLPSDVKSNHRDWIKLLCCLFFGKLAASRFSYCTCNLE